MDVDVVVVLKLHIIGILGNGLACLTQSEVFAAAAYIYIILMRTHMYVVLVRYKREPTTRLACETIDFAQLFVLLFVYVVSSFTFPAYIQSSVIDWEIQSRKWS